MRSRSCARRSAVARCGLGCRLVSLFMHVDTRSRGPPGNSILRTPHASAAAKPNRASAKPNGLSSCSPPGDRTEQHASLRPGAKAMSWFRQPRTRRSTTLRLVVAEIFQRHRVSAHRAFLRHTGSAATPAGFVCVFMHADIRRCRRMYANRNAHAAKKPNGVSAKPNGFSFRSPTADQDGAAL